jgi:hypothetical protein
LTEDLNELFNDILSIKYLTNPKFDESCVIVLIKNGIIIQETTKDVIDSSDIADIFNIDELKQVFEAIESKLVNAKNYSTTMIQIKKNIRPVLVQNKLSSDLHKVNKSYFILLEESGNRLVRLVWSIVLVLAISALCFIFVKTSIDWAQNSKQELNRIKENHFRAITDDINRKYSFIRTEC